MRFAVLLAALASCTATPWVDEPRPFRLSARGSTSFLETAGVGEDIDTISDSYDVTFGYTPVSTRFLEVGVRLAVDHSSVEQGNAVDETTAFGVFSNLRGWLIPNGQARPYLEISGGHTFAESSSRVGTSEVSADGHGPALTAGGGVNVFFTPAVSLDIGARYSFARVDIENVDVEIKGVTFLIGLAAHF